MSPELKNALIWIGALIVVTIIIFIIVKILSKKIVHYSLKPALLTATEIKYYEFLNSYFGNKYLIFPQINLASIINKDTEGWRGELFRNVDFGIFSFDFEPLVLIEINDASHLKKSRAERDKNVATICKKAGIKLVTFWTKDGFDENYMFKALNRYL